MTAVELCRFMVLAVSVALVTGESKSELVPRDDAVQEFNYHSFQTRVRAFKRECFYQHLTHNTTASLIWHVVSAGGAAELAAVVTFNRISPHAENLYASQYGQLGDFRASGLLEGTYELCIDNELSYVNKRVYIWLDYQSVREWSEAVAGDLEVQQHQFKRDLIGEILRTLEDRIRDMHYYQALYRERSFYHALSLRRLESIIDNRSLLAFVLLIVTAALQVTFVRKLFQTPTQRPTKSGI